MKHETVLGNSPLMAALLLKSQIEVCIYLVIDQIEKQIKCKHLEKCLFYIP